MNIHQFKPYVLPTAIVLGLLLHNYCAMFSFIVPYLIFLILILTFCAVDVKKLRVGWLDLWIAIFQIGVGVGGYLLMKSISSSDVLAEGVLIGLLCPVAASVAVISCMLGANRETVTSYTIVGNLMVSIAAPLIFTAIGTHSELSFWQSFLMIIRKIAPTLALPFFIVLALQCWWPKASRAIAKINGAGFWLWSFALLFTLGQTIDYIFLHGEGNWGNIAWLGLLALVVCALQFGMGKLIGHFYGDTISGGQLLGQKNTAMGIWMSNTFLNPLSAVIMAFYSIFQNLFNSWQIWRFEKKQRHSTIHRHDIRS